MVNANYSSLSVTIKNHCACRSVFLHFCVVHPLGHPLRRNGVPVAEGDRDAVEPQGMAGAPGQLPPFPRETRRLSPSNSKIIA